MHMCPDCGRDIAPVEISALTTAWYCSCGWSRTSGPRPRGRKQHKQITGFVEGISTGRSVKGDPNTKVVLEDGWHGNMWRGS